MDPISAIAGFLSGLVALAKAVPIIDSWLQALVLAYLRSRYAGMKEENIAAVHKIITTGDQRDIEKLLGYARAGEPSGVPGAVVVPSLPGVQLPPEP